MDRRVGPYQLLKPIGQGGMAQVWLARSDAVAGVERIVALKLLATGVATTRRTIDGLFDEARVSMRLVHSNIVRVHDAGQSGNDLYIAMDWVDGTDLAHLAQWCRAEDTRLPFPVVGWIVGEVLRALDYAHTLTEGGRTLGIVHRDVSPQNILLSVSGEVKLTDFGVARFAREDTSGVMMKGKLRYMAPEQVNGESRCPRVDLYALGGVLHELLDGRPFRADAKDDRALYAYALQGVLPELVHRDVPEALDRLRRALLATDPNDRPASAADALELLSQWDGFRSAAVELGRITRTFLGIHAPRSGAFAVHVPEVVAAPVPAVSVPADVTRTAVAPRGERGGAARPAWRWAAPGALAIASVSWFVGTYAAAPPREPLRDSSAALFAAVGPPAERARETQPPSQAAAGEPLARAPSPEPDELAPPGAAPAAAHPAASSEERSTPPARDALPTSGRRARVKESGSGRAGSAAPAPPARLLLRLRGPRLAYVRLDRRREYILEPTAEAEISPGRHLVEWKLRESDPWAAAEGIDLAAGSTRTLRVFPDGARLDPAGP